MTTVGRYPPEWPRIAHEIKGKAGWKCEACGAPHGGPPHVLTVDHLDYNKANCRLRNLLALCQRCHLRRQSLYPAVLTKRKTLRRLREWVDREKAQLPIETRQ